MISAPRPEAKTAITKVWQFVNRHSGLAQAQGQRLRSPVERLRTVPRLPGVICQATSNAPYVYASHILLCEV